MGGSGAGGYVVVYVSTEWRWYTICNGRGGSVVTHLGMYAWAACWHCLLAAMYLCMTVESMVQH